MYSKLPLFLLFFVLNLFMFPPSGVCAEGDAGDDGGKYIIFVVEKIAWADLDNEALVNIQRMIQQGAAGLLNTTTGGERNSSNCFVSVGAGARALGGWGAYQGFNVHEQVPGEDPDLIYERRVGEMPDGQVVNLGIESIKQQNLNRNIDIEVGILGTLLQGAGLKTAVLGNSDVSGGLFDYGYVPGGYEYRRHITTILMNDSGTVDYGNVSTDLLQVDKGSFAGMVTDDEKLLGHFRSAYQTADVIAVDYGDVSRADANREVQSEARNNRARLDALQRADNFLGHLLDAVDPEKDRVLFLCPTPSNTNKALGNTFTPVIFWGAGVTPGLLTSETTHREGIVANIDVAPSILGQYDIAKPPAMFGSPLESTAAAGNTLSLLQDKETSLVANSLRRVPLLKAIAYYLIAIIGLGITTFMLNLFSQNVSNFFKRFMYANYIAILCLPVALMMVAWGGGLSIPVSFGVVFLITILLALVTLRLPKLYHILAPSCLAVFIIIGDLLTGANLIINSPLGYDPQIGARFYGIGNELMGVLIGSSLLMFSIIMHFLGSRRGYLVVTPLMLLLLVVLVLPGVGSKAGASIAVTVSFLVLVLGKNKIGYKKVMAILGAVLLVLLSISIFDSLGTPRTHVGRSVALIMQGGFTEALVIIERKLSMNLRLMRYSYWSGVLVSSLILLIIMIKFRFKFINPIEKRYPQIINGIYASLIGAVVALVTNDSGIIAAATCSIYPIFSLLILNFSDL